MTRLFMSGIFHRRIFASFFHWRNQFVLIFPMKVNGVKSFRVRQLGFSCLLLQPWLQKMLATNNGRDSSALV